jgi:hypothetical protein
MTSAFRRGTGLSQYIIGIIGDGVFFQQSNEFVLVIHFAVVRRLIPDVSSDRTYIGFTHTETPVAALPGKTPSHPFRRARLDVQYCIGNRYRRRNLKQHVDVIFHAADFMHKDVVLLANACQIAPRPWLLFFGNELKAVLRAENDVHEILNERVCQCNSPPRKHSTNHVKSPVSRLKALIYFFDRIPTAPPWADLFSRLKALVVSRGFTARDRKNAKRVNVKSAWALSAAGLY